MQLSAFWDIAPPLHNLLASIPDADAGLDDLELIIPRQELEENADLERWPLRYLFSLCGHAKGSARQFVESQVSLWCLEEAVRETVVRESARADIARYRAGITGADGGAQAICEDEVAEKASERQACMAAELAKGVDDLKEKVTTVEGLWTEGLGGEIERVRAAVKEVLMVQGGWDEDLEEA